MADLISSDQVIQADSLVTLHFSLSLADVSDQSERHIDGTAPGTPARFMMGDGSLLPSFEARLLGLRQGAKAAFELPPDEAFGEAQAGNVRSLPRRDFADIELEPGLLVSFAAPDGELPGLVRELTDEFVLVDFNHPLAGRPIEFSVEIVKVEAAPRAASV